MAVGGKRPGAGRPKGAKNVKTLEQVKKVAESGLSPLEYMLSVMRDETEDRSIRLDAAHKVAPYVHAKLQPVDGDGDTTQKHEVKGALTWQAPQ
jgi:hypothetical protein